MTNARTTKTRANRLLGTALKQAQALQATMNKLNEVADDLDNADAELTTNGAELLVALSNAVDDIAHDDGDNAIECMRTLIPADFRIEDD